MPLALAQHYCCCYSPPVISIVTTAYVLLLLLHMILSFCHCRCHDSYILLSISSLFQLTVVVDMHAANTVAMRRLMLSLPQWLIGWCPHCCHCRPVTTVGVMALSIATATSIVAIFEPSVFQHVGFFWEKYVYLYITLLRIFLIYHTWYCLKYLKIIYQIW